MKMKNPSQLVCLLLELNSTFKTPKTIKKEIITISKIESFESEIFIILTTSQQGGYVFNMCGTTTEIAKTKEITGFCLLFKSLILDNIPKIITKINKKGKITSNKFVSPIKNIKFSNIFKLLY